jgi:hypothetical protein
MEIIDTPEKVLENVSNLINNSKFKFDYKIVDNTYIDEILKFINTHYFDKDGNFPLVYSYELIKFYLIDSLPILFYAKNKLVGLIIGKFSTIMAFDKKIETLDGNFMCLIPQLRKLHISKLIIAYLVREGIKLNKLPIKIGYYTTGVKINNEPICVKQIIHRTINYDNLINLQIVENENQHFYRKFYSKFIYPDNFKKYKIINKVDLNNVDEITNKINIYQKEKFDIYEYVSNIYIKNIIESDAFIKYSIINNTTIEAFVVFYKIDIYNKKLNKNVRTLYLHYYYVNNGNILDYLELIGENMKKNDVCDMFLTNLFDETIPTKYFKGTGRLYYNLWNVKDFKIKEQKVQLIVI